MASHQRRALSIGQTLTATVSAVSAAVGALYSALTDASVYKQHNWPFLRIFGLKFLQRFMALQDQPWVDSIFTTTGEGVKQTCQKQKWSLTSHRLSSGSLAADATLHEIVVDVPGAASPRALLYFHGGGYKHALTAPSHVLLAQAAAVSAGATRLFILEYTTAPAQKYPVQLSQGVAALQKLLVDLEYTPSQVILGGDSAGGNMTFALFAHYIQPNPRIEAAPDLKGQKFRGALCISPWVTMKTTSASYKANEGTDMLSKRIMGQFTDWYAGNPKEVWVDMFQGDEAFWRNVPVESILLTAGSLELFKDDIVTMETRLKAAKAADVKVTLVVAEGEVHDQILVDFALGTARSKSTTEILQWCLTLK